MSQFTTALIVSPLADGKSWVILDDFRYYVGSEESDDVINVSIGFVTDFASVPRPFWWVIPRWGKYGNAAVIHDWLYWEQGDKDRKQADDILLEGMNVLNVSGWQKTAIYYAVRWFGWMAWFRNKAEKETGFNRIISTSGIKATMPSKRPSTIKSAYAFFINKRRGKTS